MRFVEPTDSQGEGRHRQGAAKQTAPAAAGAVWSRDHEVIDSRAPEQLVGRWAENRERAARCRPGSRHDVRAARSWGQVQSEPVGWYCAHGHSSERFPRTPSALVNPNRGSWNLPTVGRDNKRHPAPDGAPNGRSNRPFLYASHRNAGRDSPSIEQRRSAQTGVGFDLPAK